MKKLVVFLLTISILIVSSIPAFSVADNAKLTYLYLDKGNIIIGDGTVSGYGYFGERITTYDPDGYFITQTTTDNVLNTITFNGGENYVVFKALNVNVMSHSKFTCAVCISDSSDVTVKLEGVNVFLSGDSRAGVEVSVDSTVTFIGEGSILAGSNYEAGIGGGNGNSCGTIIVNSGFVTGKSNVNSAGIGGGSSGSNGKVIINGGNVSALGGTAGAGIGGGCTGDGGEVIINGGTVTATGGTYGAGIGGGWYGDMGNVIINGGSVKASAGSKVPIGGGVGGISGDILNSNGEKLYLATFDSSSVSSIKHIYTDGISNNISSYHSGDKKFYFYLPAGTHIIAADSDSLTTSFWEATYTTSFSISSVVPFECINSSSVREDDIIRGLECGLSSLENYVEFAEEFSFSYSDSVIGTGADINLIFDDKTVFTYKALVYGDVDGDGFYDGEDSMVVSLMLWGHLTEENTAEYYFEAGDVNRNSKIDSDDISVLKKAGLLLASVPQNEDGTLNTDSTEWAQYTLLVEQSEKNNEEYDSFLIDLMSFIRFIAEYIKNLIVSLVII